MAEYIDRDVAKDELLSWAVCIKHPEHLMKEDAMHILDSIPAADVVEVKHGWWIYTRIDAICSHCGFEWFASCQECGVRPDNTNYCPNCGARMDGADVQNT